MTAARRVSPATGLFALAVAASGVVLIAWQSHLTFFYDDWDPLLHRRAWSADSLLHPHFEHILLATTFVYKAIQSTIGMESLLPYAVAATAAFLVSVVLLFIYMQRRVGDWLALAGVLPVLFLGAASKDLLWPFQIFFFGAMACGIGALLAIERPRPRNDAVACLLLAAGFTFSELALPFAFGVAVAIVQDRGPWRRAYVVGVPLLLYAAWYAGWGHTGPSYLSFSNVAHSLVYVLDGLASGITSLLGLTPSGFVTGSGLSWGRPLLLVLVVVTVLRLRSGAPVSRWLWVSGVVLLSFWFLTAFNVTPGRPPFASRYQFIAVVLLLLVAADLASGVVRPRRPVIVIALVVAGLATVGNLSTLHQGYLALREVTPAVRGGLAGLEITADTVDPNLTLDQGNSAFNYIGSIRAGPYLSAVREFGSPAYSQSELPSAPERARESADLVTATALRLRLQPTTKRPPGLCATVGQPGGGQRVLSVPPGNSVYLSARPGATARLALRRFSTQSFPVALGTLSGSAGLTIPTDHSNVPWQLQVSATGPVTVCEARAG